MASVHRGEVKMCQLHGESNTTETFAEGSSNVGESNPEGAFGAELGQFQVLLFQSQGCNSTMKLSPGVPFQGIPLLRRGLLHCPVVIWPNQREGFAPKSFFSVLCGAALPKRPSFLPLAKQVLPSVSGLLMHGEPCSTQTRSD